MLRIETEQDNVFFHYLVLFVFLYAEHPDGNEHNFLIGDWKTGRKCDEDIYPNRSI